MLPANLRSRIILIIFLSILPLLGVFFYLYLEECRDEEEHAQDLVLRVARQFSIHQERLINEARQLLLTLSHYPAVRQRQEAACRSLFSQLTGKDASKTPVYANLVAADVTGHVFGSARPLRDLQVLPDFSVFQRTLETKDSVVGGWHTGPTLGETVLQVGYPVLDRSGKVEAVLVGCVSLDWFHDLAAKMRLPSGSSICIIDHRGTIMARLHEPEKWVGQTRPEAEIIKTVLAQGEGVTAARGVDGNDRLYAFTPLAALPAGGYVYVGIPTPAIYTQTRQNLMRNLLAVLGVATLALMLAWLLGYPFVTRRLDVLVGTAQKVAAGDLSARTGWTYGAGKIDHLARSFDGMAQALQLREADRVQAEKALKDSEGKYRLLVNQIPAVVYKAYADCTIDFFDHKVEALTGYSKESFDSRTLLWKQLILPEDLPEARKKFIHALKTNKAYVREYRIRRKDGEIRWIHNRGQIFCDASGKIDSVSGVLFDISDRKQAEEKLYRASRALRALGECNQALVHAREESAFLQDVCRIIVEVTGYRLSWVGFPQHDPGKTILPAAQAGRHGENAGWIKNSWADDDVRGGGPGGRAIRTGRTQVIRNILEDPALAPWHEEARRQGYNSVIVLPLTLEEETIAILDILSEEVNAFDPEEIQLLEELANNVSQGIAILRERAQRRQAMAEKTKLEMQLRHAQKMEAIGTLAGGIAHDFNNILSAIVGYSELILLNLDQKQDLQLIENHLMGVLQAGKRAKDLVQQILTFSRKKEQGSQPVQVSLIVKEALKLLRASLPTTIEILYDIDPQCGLVLADPTQIHQVVINIGTNAYHAMREDGGVLEIKLEAVEVDARLANIHPHLHEGAYLRLSVRDTGRGMEPEVLERIFEPYYTTKGPAEGTGLGLAVVHGIVSGLGGAILVDSRVGQGTTFQVYFPSLEVAGQEEVLDAVPAEPVATSTKGEHILFIDDEPVLAHIGEKVLKRLGYRVTVQTSSLEALELFSAQPNDFDLVISDQTMPHLTGSQLARKIALLRPEMPIILCTGSGQTITAKETPDNAIREYLLKPFNVRDLAETIQRVLHPGENVSPTENSKLTC